MKTCTLVHRFFQDMMSTGQNTLREFVVVVMLLLCGGSFTQAHRELSWEVFTSGQRQFNITPKYKDKQNEETRLLLPGGFSVYPSRDLE